MFCRFLNKRPSVFEILDDPEAALTFVESIVLELSPRARDEGQLSWWAIHTDSDKDRVIAGYAARRPHRDDVHALSLPREFLTQAALDIQHAPDEQAFECIVQLHYLINMGDEGIRKAFARCLFDALEQRTLHQEQIYHRIRKGEILEYIKRIYCQCIQQGGTVDITKAAEWIRETLANMHPNT